MRSFEDQIDTIEDQLNKRRSKWHLHAVTWMDFDDVKQLIRLHIRDKWHLWDQSRPIEPWLNKLITNKMTNLIRDNYGSFSRPCLKCGANEGADLCSVTRSGKQCSECPLYSKWVKRKKIAHDIKLPVSYDDIDNFSIHETVSNGPYEFIDYNSSIDTVHHKMKEKLKPEHFNIYEMLYIFNLSEDEVAKKMGYKRNKYNNKNKYKQLENYKKQFVETARVLIKDHIITNE